MKCLITIKTTDGSFDVSAVVDNYSQEIVRKAISRLKQIKPKHLHEMAASPSSSIWCITNSPHTIEVNYSKLV